MDASALSDEQFDAMFSQPTVAQSAAAGVAPSQVDDSAFDRMFATDAKPQDAYKPEQPWTDYYSQKWQYGDVSSVQRGLIGGRVFRDELRYEDVKNDASTEKLKQLQESNIALEQAHPYLLGDWSPMRWIGEATESLPFMIENFKGGAAGAATGAALGAGAAAAAGQLGPQVAIPEEIATVPAGAAFGARWGFRFGSFKTSAELMTGNTYLDFLDKGLSPEIAKPAAAASGVISGVIEAAELSQLTNIGRKAFVQQLATKEGKETLGGWVAKYLKDVGIQVVEEDLQEITELTAQTMAAAIDQNEGAMPTAEEWKQRLVDTTIKAAQASTVLVAGSEVSGAVPGKTLETLAQINKTADNLRQSILEGEAAQRGAKVIQGAVEKVAQGKADIVTAFELLKQGMDKQAPTAEQVAEADSLTPGQILDDVLKPLYDKDGNLQVDNEPATLQARVQQIVEKVQPHIEEALAGAPSLEVEGRKRQVRSDLADIDAKIQTLEKEQARRESEGKPTVGVQKQIDRLYEIRAGIDEELVQLDYGEIQAEDLKGQDIKVKADKVLALRAKSVKDILKNFKKGVKEGVKFTEQEIKGVQTRLVSLIKSSDLTAQDKSKFLDTVKNIQNQAQLSKQLPQIQKRIDALIEKDEQRTAVARVKKLFKQSELKKDAQYPRGKFTADIQKTLNKYKAYASDPAARQAAIDKFDAALASGQEPDEQTILDNYIAQSVGALGEVVPAGQGFRRVNLGTSKQINELGDQLQSLMEQGRADALDKLMAQQAENAENKTIGYQSVQGSQPFKESEKGESVKNNLRKFGRTFFANNETWKGLMQLLSQHDKTHALVKLLDPTNARETYFELQDVWQKRMSQDILAAIKDAGIQTNARKLGAKLAADEHVSSKGIGEYIDQNGEQQTLYRSRAQVRKLWMEIQAAKVDPVIKESLKQANGFTFREDVPAGGSISTEQLVEEVLTKEDIAIAQAQLKIYDDIYNEILNPYWRELYGVDLPKSEMYSPLRREGYTVKDDATLMEIFLGEGGNKPSSTIKRQGSLLKIGEQSDISALRRHLEQATRFVAYDKFDRDSKIVLQDGKIRQLIKDKYGDKVLSMVMTHRRDITSGRMFFDDVAWKWVDDWRKRTATAYIGAKLSSIPKQATAMFTALDRVGPVEFLTALAKTTAAPLKVAGKLRESATVRRLLVANDRDIVDVIAGKKQKNLPGGLGFLDFMLMPVRIGVGYATLVSGEAVYTDAIKKGATKVQALQTVNDFLTDTQQAGFVENLSGSERNNALSRLLTMFGGDPFQAARQIVRANREILANPKDAKAYVKALRTYFVFHLTVPMMFQLMANATDGDDDDEDQDNAALIRTAIFGPWIQIPILGDTLSFALINAQNAIFDTDEYAFEPSNPVLASLVHLGKFIGKQTEALIEDDYEKQVKALGHLAKASPVAPRAVGGGLPWPEVIKWFKAIFGDDE